MTVSLLLSVAVAASLAQAEETFDAGQALRAAAKHLPAAHLSDRTLDDETASAWMRTFLKRLDPRAMYFLANDVAEFGDLPGKMSAHARDGDFRFAKLVGERYKMRVAEAAQLAEEWLVHPHDFTIDEEAPLRWTDYSADLAQRIERWRLRIKLESLVEKAHGRPAPETLAWLRSRYRHIERQAHEMDDERLCDILIESLAMVFDPHSGYYSLTDLESFNQTIRLRNYRTGLIVRQVDGEYAIAAIHPDFSACADRLDLVGWTLLAVERLNGEVHHLVELPLEDYRALITGPFWDDTEVVLQLMHPITFQRQTLSWPRLTSRLSSG